jgi:hypothetical protein
VNKLTCSMEFIFVHVRSGVQLSDKLSASTEVRGPATPFLSGCMRMRIHHERDASRLFFRHLMYLLAKRLEGRVSR